MLTAEQVEYALPPGVTVERAERALAGLQVQTDLHDDLGEGVLRHVSPAFAEDPVRILRVARFAARFDFTVAPETQALMVQMVQDGEADALVAERVWQELAKGLMEKTPSAMFAILRECGALARVLPQIDALYDAAQDGEAMAALDTAAQGIEAGTDETRSGSAEGESPVPKECAQPLSGNGQDHG